MMLCKFFFCLILLFALLYGSSIDLSIQCLSKHETLLKELQEEEDEEDAASPIVGPNGESSWKIKVGVDWLVSLVRILCTERAREIEKKKTKRSEECMYVLTASHKLVPARSFI